MSGRTPHTRVDFIDDKPHDVGHVTRAIHVNGSPVCIELDSLFLDYSPDGPTRVTVTLIVDEIHFTKAGADENAKSASERAATGDIHVHNGEPADIEKALSDALRRREFRAIKRP